MTLLEGIDTSNYQHPIDFQTVVAVGTRFVWELITDGPRFKNPHRQDHVAGYLSVGLPVGGYHFARFGNVANEAAQFLAACPDGLDLPHMLDGEASWLADRSANTDWILEWFARVGSSIPVFYTNGEGANHRVVSQRLVDAGVRLWYAHPGHHDLGGAAAWDHADIVQYSTDPIDGIHGNCDRDIMESDTLAEYLGTPHAPVPIPQEDDMQVIYVCAHTKDGTSIDGDKRYTTTDFVTFVYEDSGEGLDQKVAAWGANPKAFTVLGAGHQPLTSWVDAPFLVQHLTYVPNPPK